MTRIVVYAGSLAAFLGAAGMSTAAVLLPSWANYVMYPTDPDADPFWLTLGLHQVCASDSMVAADGGRHGPFHRRSGFCRPFPRRSIDCAAGSALPGTGSVAGLVGLVTNKGAAAAAASSEHFCTNWRTAGFLMESSLLIELVILVGFLAILVGGDNRRMKRHFGWRVLSPLLVLAALLQLAAMAVVAHVVQHDSRFLVPGWSLATSWKLCTASWVVALVAGLGLALSAWVLPPEDGYDFLDDLASDDGTPFGER